MGTHHQGDWCLCGRIVQKWTSKKHNVDWIHLGQILYNSRSSEQDNKLSGPILKRNLLTCRYVTSNNHQINFKDFYTFFFCDSSAFESKVQGKVHRYTHTYIRLMLFSMGTKKDGKPNINPSNLYSKSTVLKCSISTVLKWFEKIPICGSESEFSATSIFGKKNPVGTQNSLGKGLGFFLHITYII